MNVSDRLEHIKSLLLKLRENTERTNRLLEEAVKTLEELKKELGV
jgi:hypothetical protein